MNQPVPRLRMFAGPNGSGKSTLKEVLPAELLGIYINPDEIEREIRQTFFLDFTIYGIQTTQDTLFSFLRNSALLQKSGLCTGIDLLQFSQDKLFFKKITVNSYFASVISDFLRQNLLRMKKSFTFETVMSSSDKIDFLEKAQTLGYRTYLYYIATDDPIINISRVKYRVKQGGHNVPEDKIRSRYDRSLSLLRNAITHTNRAYIFDNSGHGEERVWLAEITDGKILELKVDSIPAWFKHAVFDKI